MSNQPPMLKRESSLSIVQKKDVSLDEEGYHELEISEANIEEAAGPVEKNGVSNGEVHDPKQGWSKIAKTVHFSAAMNAEAPQLEEGGTLELTSEDFRVGVPYRFKVHLDQLPDKTLMVTCEPQDGATIKIATHEKEGVVTYMCTLVPLKEGKFTISTLFGKKNVLGSPFEVNFNPPADASQCKMLEAPPECRTSVDRDTLTFCVKTNQEREGTLTAYAKSIEGKKSVPVTISESAKGHYDVEFDAKDGKKYRMSVKFDNQHISGSPFLLHLSDASVCKVTGEGITQGVVGQENHFEVATKGAGPGKLRVKVEGKTQTVVTIKPKENDMYEVTYFPKKVGSYSISVMWLDEEIPDSPFHVNCYKPVSVTLPKPEKNSVYKVGETYKFKIDAKESGEGSLKGRCMGEEDSAKVEVENLGKGQYKVEVVPKKIGTIQISITWAGQEVPGSPFLLEADGKPDSAQITTTGPVYEVGSSKPVVLEVNTEKGGGGKLKATCSGEKTKNVPVKVVESQAKVHSISFEPPKPDVYTLWVTWSKKQIPGSPFTINLHPANAQNCQLVSAPLVPEDWKEPAVIKISTVGAGNGKLKVKAVGKEGGSLAEEHLQVNDKEPGETELMLVAPTPDIYTVTLNWGGEEIPKSPLIINRIPPNAEKCFASVSRFGRKWQEDVYVYIDATTAGNGKLTALAVGSVSGDVTKHISVTPDDKELGKYVVKFTPNEPDTYTFTVEWSGMPIPGFPCDFNRNRYQPNEVTVYEPPAGLMKVGQDISIGVDASRGGPGRLTSTCTANKEGDIPVTVEKKEDHKYKVYFTPPAKDVYSLSVFWGGEHIKGSPFNIDMVPVNPDLVVASEPAFPQGLEGPVEMTLSTEDAGRAPVTALCMGGKSGRVPVTVTQTSYSKFKLSFTPPQPDLFTMGVQYGNQNIRDSPFHINTYPPNATMVSVVPPEQTDLGETVSFKCDASKAGHGKLSAVVTGERSGAIDADISQSGVANYTVSFLPQEPDIYSISIKWEGEEVSKSPFVVNLLPLDPGLITVESVHIPDEAGSEYAHVTIDCSKVGVAPLITNVLGDNLGDVPTEIEELSNFRRRIKFIPPKDDKYTVSVLFNNGDIPGSPFIMSIVSPQPEKVKLTNVDIPNQQSPPVVLTFNTTDAGKGTLQASIKGQKTGEVTDHQESEVTPGSWNVSFIPSSPDTYDVSCVWAKKEIPQSPFKVDLSQGVASKVVVGEIHIPEEAGTGEEVWLDLDCSAAGHEVVRGIIEDAASFTNTQEPEIKTLGLKQFRVKFEPKEPRLYHFIVRYGRDQVPGSPFEVDLQLCIPEGVKIKEKSLPQFSDGTEGHIVVDTKEAGRGKLTANMSGKNTTKNIPLEIQEILKKKYKIVFIPPSPDSYTIDIFWSDIPIPSPSHQFTVLQPICPENVVCGRLTCSAPRKLAQLNVSTHRAGHAQLTATCEGEKCGEVDTKIETSKTDKDSYMVTFTPPMEDVYSLSVRYCGALVPGSPFPLDLVPRILLTENIYRKFQKEEEMTLDLPVGEDVDGGGKNGTEESYLQHYIGEPFSVNVSAETKQQRESPLTATAVGDRTGKVPISITKNPDGTQDVSFNPDRPDRYKIDVLLGGTPVISSPFIVVFQHFTDPLKCFLFDSSDLKLPIYVDQEVIFGMNATKAGNGELKVTAKTPDEKPAPSEITEPDIGTYYVSYTPRRAGTHQMKLQWGFGEIPESPLKLEVQEPAVPVYCNGKPITIQLKKVQGLPSELTATASHVRSKSSYKVAINQVKKGEYMLVFEADQPGMYRVNILQSGNEIKSSPYYVRYAPPSNPSACTVSGFTSPGHIGEKTAFTVDTSSAGFGEISVRPDIPHSGMESTVNIRDNRNGTYLVQYTPQAVGEHRIHVMWSDEAIPGSPFSLKVVKTSEDFAQLADGQEKLFKEPRAIQNPLEFVIEAPSGQGGKLAVSCHGPGKPDIKIKDNKNRSYTCHFVSSEPGNYWIHVLWKQRHIEGSPFPLTVIPTKAIKVLGLNAAADSKHASSVRIVDEDKSIFEGPQALGSDVVFRLVTGNAGKGELSISCVGPGNPEVELAENHDGTHTCNLKGIEQGEYKVFVLWERIHIRGSPFSMTFLPPKAVQMLGLNAASDPGHASNVAIMEKDKYIFSQPQPVKPVKFSIFTSDGGKGELCVSAKGTGEISVKILESKSEGVQSCLLTPSRPGQYDVYVLWNKIHIPGSPFTVCFTSKKARELLGITSSNRSLSTLSRVHVILKDIEVFNTPQPLNTPVLFHVSTKNAGKGVLTVTTQGPGKPEVKIGDVKNNLCACTITTGIAGKYKIHLLWNNKRVDDNPYELLFQSKQRQMMGIDLENAVLPLNHAYKFKVFYKEVSKGKLEMFCRPSSAAEISVSPLSDEGYYLCEVTPLVPGNHNLIVQYNNRDVLGSPFCVHFESEMNPHPLIFPTPPIPHNIHVSGPGIKEGTIGQEGNFTIDTSKAGIAKLDFEVVGPAGGFNAQLRQHWENERILLARYDPTLPGEYRLVMRWAGIEIPGSPFTVHIKDQN